MCLIFFSGNLAVLVNGCPTQEIIIQKGLMQGDLITPFLFLLADEGLNELFSKVVDQHVFLGIFS